MKLHATTAPHIRHPESSRTLMSDAIILLLVLCVLAFLYYGARALLVCAVSVAAAVASELICVLLRGRKPNPRDLSAVVTGLVIALMMPATISFTAVVTAAVFAIAIVKHPFGGTGSNLFNPAAAGFSFAAICWPAQVFSYPMPFDRIPLWGQAATSGSLVFQGTEATVRLYQNPVFVLKVGGIPTNSLTEMLLGNYPGPMGATNILVLLACLCYLIYRGTVRWQLPLSFLASCAAVVALFPRESPDRMQSLLYELMSGLLLFAAVFLLSDPVTRPKRDSALVVYGIFAGIITMFCRYTGGFEESVTFAVLLANAVMPAIDRHNEELHRLLRRKRFEVRKLQKTPQA